MAISKRVATIVFGGLASLGVTSCTPPTAFEGSAQFPGGALGCFKQCQKVGMDMASYVYVGEYSTACACKPKIANVQGSAAAREEDEAGDEATVQAAAAGVELQRRRIAEQQRAALSANKPR